MSEYQYYEFQTLDRRLTGAEMAELGTLSSRVALTSTSAIFTYNYGDFRGKPKRVLEQYFDVMLYIANWGTRRLMFRFPKGLVNIEAMRPYCIPHTVTMETTASHLILDILIDKEESEWIETGEGRLTRLIPLRGAIMEGDYRALYLAWLRACELQLDTGDTDMNLEEDDEDDEDDEDEGYGTDYDYGDRGGFFGPATLEPPAPPNLTNLDGALQAFIEFFEIDPLWIEAGAKASAPVSKPDEPLEQWIASLPEEDCRRLLLRAAQGETNIVLSIRNELRERFAQRSQSLGARKLRTAGQLAAIVQERRMLAAEEKHRQGELARVRRLEALAQREATVWEQAVAFIHQRNAKGYDQAVSLLCELGELAEYRGEQIAFHRRLEHMREQFPTLSGLKSRLAAARLIKG